MMSYFRLNLRELMAFRLNFTMVFGQLIAGTIQFFLFWLLLGNFSLDSTFGSWSFREISFIVAFYHLNFSLFMLLSVGFLFLPILVIRGDLDDILILPVSPTKGLLGRSLSPDRLLYPLVSVVILVLALVINPMVDPLLLLLGILVAIAASLLENIFMMSFNLLSFWIGGMQAVVQALNNVYTAKQFPLDGLRGAGRFILTFIIPIFFMATFPAEIITQRITFETLLWGVGSLAGLLVIWIWLFRSLWFRGLRNYQSGGSL